MIFTIYLSKKGSYPEYKNISYKSKGKDKECNRKLNKPFENPIHKIANWPTYMKRCSTY